MRAHPARTRHLDAHHTPHYPYPIQPVARPFYRLTNNIDAMHRGCTFLIRKVQDTSAQLPDVRPSTQVA